jgi:putative inorganic carbon (hco3(-)) transporter
VGFALTVFYIAMTIISPDQFGPDWAHYHALQYLAGITFLFSLPNILGNVHLRSSIQTFLLVGFILAIGLSEVANGWIGGIVASWQVFLPSAAVFFFIVANVTSIRRLKIVALATIAACLIVVVEALCGYYAGFRGDMFVVHHNLYSNDEAVGQISRLRGPGFLNDPNDFAQILLIALPLIFILWEKRRRMANLPIVFFPAAVLLWATYLTHSRGALIALAVLALMAARKSIGYIASAILVTALILGLLALDFTGGRGISAIEGADRLEAWANGLEIFKSAPLFGIGFGAFTDFNDITAHNSFVLCLAELGLVGSTLWVASLVTSMAGLSRIINDQEKEEIVPASTTEAERHEAAAFATAGDFETTSEAPDRLIVPTHWAVAIRMALVSFITTGWFLSRGYKTPMYLVVGLATAVIALQGNANESRIRGRWVSSTLAVETFAIIFVYAIVRLRR